MRLKKETAILRAQDLPYTAGFASRLHHYARFLLMPSAEKTQWLMQFARLDPFYARIVAMLEEYGHYVEHQFYGHSGAYLPDNIETAEECNTAEAVKMLHAQGVLKARFVFSSRFGGAQIAHYWLHELMHFWQDLHGLYLTPVKQKDAAPIMLDAASHVAVTCFCEAMAETEALRASWRLKEQGHTIAWLGALASLDWGQQARAYDKDMQNMPEVEAARHAFDRWYTSGQRTYYEKRAFKAYTKTLKSLGDLKPQLRYVGFVEYLNILPASERPEYLTLMGKKPISDPLYITIQHKGTARQASALEAAYGIPEGAGLADIRMGAAPFIWKWATDKITLYTD